MSDIYEAVGLTAAVVMVGASVWGAGLVHPIAGWTVMAVWATLFWVVSRAFPDDLDEYVEETE